ncbi:alpha-L-fucosidase [Segetibacter sp. 3557_3]|uniref:alpha-L-fucosidase n=1 Tax=Segetibacter sp. 3557_3 TaxID=2547429 RepID=UPI0010586CB5|nr:alpha-L-fucosidase [Segetibacter sp. 3557_3]TDH20080.1 alpha-L-fucosidase [Segetibacter sp. 3557_3]
MNKRLYTRFLVTGLALFAVTSGFAQDKGDEAAAMFNQEKTRDQLAINEAVAGWWTSSMKSRDQRLAWWREAKFGMFIHWGVYSDPAGEWKEKRVGGYAEHLMRKERILRSEYLQVAHNFNPSKFNADEWVQNAKGAGMRYLVITAKHHDGFAMYPSLVSDFNLQKQTPFKRDPMAELSAACKRWGLKFGFYYSHAFDWEHPDAPGNDWEYKNPGGDSNLYGGVTWYDQHPELLVKAQRYVDEKAIPQIKELLVKYRPDILWFDTPQKLPLSENIRILKAIRETDQHVVVNGRLVRSGAANFGDYKNTADRPAEFYPVSGDWEAIPTTNESYGFSKYDSSHKPVAHFVRLIASAASRGGNLLMNIGPKGDGTFDARDLNILGGIGKWMEVNGESIYGTKAGSLPLQSWGVTTFKNNRLYLHVYNWPQDGKLVVGGLISPVSKVYFLSKPGSNLSFSKQGNKDLVIQLPFHPPDSLITVIVVETKTGLILDTTRYVSTNTGITRLLAYDATQTGKGFSFGDGKTDRYYVEGWKQNEQSLHWNIRTGSAARFRVVIRYLAAPNSGGSYELSIGSLKVAKEVVTQKRPTQVTTEEIGIVQMPAGMNTIVIRAKEIKTELMKLLEVQLIPVNQ